MSYIVNDLGESSMDAKISEHLMGNTYSDGLRVPPHKSLANYKSDQSNSTAKELSGWHRNRVIKSTPSQR